MSAMKRLFQLMADKKASDIFLSIGAPINIKINGLAMPVNQTILTSSAVQSLLYEVLNEHQVREFEEELELNTAYTLEGVGTFRISAFRQKGTPAVVVRFIPGAVPPLASLGLPAVLKEIVMQKRGLIRYSRGDITILDRRGLEGAACACYALDRKTYSNVMN